MTCDLATERMLTEPETVSPELREHLTGCPACVAMRSQIRSLDSLIREAPVVDSTPAKAAFIASLQSRVVTPSTLKLDSTSRGRAYLTAAMLAASVLLAVGTFALWPKPNDVVKTNPSSSSHALLTQSVAFACEQTTQQPNRRLQSSTQYAGHLVSELRGIYQAAGPDDAETVRVLAELVKRTLNDGLNEATIPTHPIERLAALDPLMPQLAGLTEATRAMSLTAPLHNQPLLAKLEADIEATTNRLVAFGAKRASPANVPQPAGANAGTELVMIRQNRSLIEILATRGLKAASANDDVARLNELRAGSQAIETALAEAVKDGNADRAGELGERLASVYSDGVVTTLTAASVGHENPESPSFARVQELKAKLKDDAQRVRVALPTTGALGNHPRIESARKLLNDATERIL